jgi:Phage integrase, N-terminal SAM-like domain
LSFNALLERYVTEEMPTRHATKGSYSSIINSHLRPQWGSYIVSEIRPAQIHTWFQSLALAPVSKGHVRSLMHKLFDLATLWEYLPLERRNPIDIVKIKNVTRRAKDSWPEGPGSYCVDHARHDSVAHRLGFASIWCSTNRPSFCITLEKARTYPG